MYGLGDHIDESDNHLGYYPTKPPTAGLEGFRDGCYICQPTAFFSRGLIDEIGSLDTRLTTAFDMEWWMRAFDRIPERIGFMQAHLASTRLHGSTITTTRRETAVLETMELIFRYTHRCPSHWVQTRVDEILAEGIKLGQPGEPVKRRMEQFLRQAAPYLTTQDRALSATSAQRAFRSVFAPRSGIKDWIYSFARFVQQRRWARMISRSNLFDAAWYVGKYQNEIPQRMNPALHYVRIGADKGLNPSLHFDTDFYLKAHPDVLLSRMNPLAHFIKHGRREGRISRQVTQTPTDNV